MARKLKFQAVLEEFLSIREWQDELNVYEEEKAVGLVTGVNIGDYSGGKLVIEAFDETELVSVFFYLPFACKDSKRGQMAILLNEINTRGNVGGYGCFQLSDDGQIRWVHKVDFEGSSPTGKSVEQIVGPGWERCGAFVDVIQSVALTKQTASEALREFDQPDESGEGPSEL